MKNLICLFLLLFSAQSFATDDVCKSYVEKLGDGIVQVSSDKKSCECVKEGAKIELDCTSQEEYVKAHTSGDNIISSEKLATCFETQNDSSVSQWRTEANKFDTSNYFSNNNSAEILCNKNIASGHVYYKNIDAALRSNFSNNEKSPLNVSNADIVEEPKKSCTNLWGGKAYLPDTESETPSFPDLDFMCAMAEKSQKCSRIGSLVSTIRSENELKTALTEAIKNLSEGNSFTETSVSIQMGNGDDGTLVLSLKDMALGEEGRSQGGGADFSKSFQQPVALIDGVYGAGASKVQILVCPEVIKAGQNNVDECLKEFKKTVFGLYKDVNSNTAGAYILQMSKVVNREENNFQSFVSCRNTEVAALYQNKILPCRSLQSIAQINAYQDNSEETQSFDGKFKCVKEDAFTADYRFCKRMIHTYNGIMASQSIAKSAEEISMGSANLKAQEKTLEDPTNIQKNALEGQKIIIDRTITHKYAEVGMHTAFAGTIGGLLMSWPVPKNIHKKCDYKSGCCMHASANYYTRIYKNYGMKKLFTREVFMHMGKAASAGVLAHLWNQQKNKLKMYQDELAGLEAEEYVPQNTDLIVNHCMQDPTAPGCSNQPRDLVSSGAVGQSAISFNGAGGTPVGTNSALPESSNYFSNDDDSNLNDNDKARLNDMIADGITKKGGFADGLPSAAKYSRGGGAPGGGAGGGGGGASASGLGRKPSSTGGKKKDMVFGSGGAKGKKSRGFSYRGGGFGRRRSKGSSNPFDGLKKGSGKGGVTHRGVASDIAGKSSGLFKKISARYVKISGSKRLMEYKQDE